MVAKNVVAKNVVAKKVPSLELIQIASPCTADWNAMSGDERSRHCRACNLQVYNISDMTREEATAFIASREGRTCIRIFKRADGTVITRDCPVGIAALRARFVRLVLATAGLVLTLMVTAAAAVMKAPSLRSYLTTGKLDRLYPPPPPQMVMGGCPAPPIMPNPTGNPPPGQALLGGVGPE